MGMEMPNSFKIQDPARTDTTQMTKQYRATFLAAFFLSGRFRPVSRGSTINAEPTGFTAGKSEKNPTNTSCRKGKLNDIDVGEDRYNSRTRDRHNSVICAHKKIHANPLHRGDLFHPPACLFLFPE